MYYVEHPSLGIAATVDAPTTEKARTTFLDYLERSGRIKRSQRQLLRENMIAKKLKDGSEAFDADIHLDYDYQHTEEPEPFVFGQEPLVQETQVQSQEQVQVQSQVQSQPIQQEQPQPQVKRSGSPIGQVAVQSVLGGRG